MGLSGGLLDGMNSPVFGARNDSDGCTGLRIEGLAGSAAGLLAASAVLACRHRLACAPRSRVRELCLTGILHFLYNLAAVTIPVGVPPRDKGW